MKIKRECIQEQWNSIFIAIDGIGAFLPWWEMLLLPLMLFLLSCSLFYNFGYMFLTWSSSGCIVRESNWLICQKSNSRPSTSLKTVEKTSSVGWTVLPHPSYSLDLAHSDFHLFGQNIFLQITPSEYLKQ